MLVLVALAIPATAFAAISGQGGGTTIADGQATLVSDDATPYSFISFDDLNGQPVANLTELSADVVSGTGWGGGSPRFQVKVSNGSATQNIFVYLGDLPNLDMGSTGSTGNLLDTGVRIDSTKIGGPVYGSWADAKAAAAASGYTTISNIALMVDGGWKAPQTFVFDAVSINGTVNPFGPVGPVCEATGFYRDGHELTAAQIGGDVTGTLDASGCDIGVYYAPNTKGSVKTADISGALYYGVVANAANVNVTGSAIHNIGDKPSFNGMQRGVGVFYTTLDQTNDGLYQNGKAYITTGAAATGTLSGNVISAYQKTGVAVNGPGATVTVKDNTVTGLGPVGFIAQNGVQVSRGATGLITGNTVSGHWYTPADWTSCGLIFFQADGVKQKANSSFGNQMNLCNAGRGGGNTSL
jgi:hypothetical protein